MNCRTSPRHDARRDWVSSSNLSDTMFAWFACSQSRRTNRRPFLHKDLLVVAFHFSKISRNKSMITNNYLNRRADPVPSFDVQRNEVTNSHKSNYDS
jgi:hypothetical protein